MEESKNNNPYNLKNLSPILYKTIKEYNLSKLHFAKQLYADEWDDTDEEIKQKLTVRFRNKYDNNGRLTPDELIQIQNVLLEMADTIKKNVGISITEKTERKREKIKKLLEQFENLDDEAINKIDDLTIDKLKKEL